MAAYDDLNTKRIFGVGILSVVVMIVTALAVQVIYFYMVDIQAAETAAASDYRRQNSVLQQQQAEISTYGVDPLTGNIIIPIDKAIEKMVGESKQESPASESQVQEGHDSQAQETQAQEASSSEET